MEHLRSWLIFASIMTLAAMTAAGVSFWLRFNQTNDFRTAQAHAWHVVICDIEAQTVANGGNPDTDRMCYTCKLPRPRTEFVKCKTWRDGMSKICRSCDAKLYIPQNMTFRGACERGLYSQSDSIRN